MAKIDKIGFFGFEESLFKMAEKAFLAGQDEGFVDRGHFGECKFFIDRIPPEQILIGPLMTSKKDSPIYGKKLYVGV